MSDYKLTKEQEKYLCSHNFSENTKTVMRQGFEEGVNIEDIVKYVVDKAVERNHSPEGQNYLHWAMLNAQLDIFSGVALACLKDVAEKRGINLDAFDETVNYQKLYEQIRDEADRRSTAAYESGFESLGEQLDSFSSSLSYERSRYGIDPDIIVDIEDEG